MEKEQLNRQKKETEKKERRERGIEWKDKLPVGIPGVTFDNDCNGWATDDEVHTLDDGIIAVGVDGDDNVFPQVDLLCVSTLPGCRFNDWYWWLFCWWCWCSPTPLSVANFWKEKNKRE